MTEDTIFTDNNDECISVSHVSLTDVHEIFKKWLYVTDTNVIDTILATYLSYKVKGDHLWLFLVGNSGDGKSELLKSLSGCKDVLSLDQLTPNTLASGKPNVDDLGNHLQDENKILLFKDVASLTSLHKDAKKQIWGQLRTLYDGYINKITGSGVEKKYNNCNVTLITATTPVIWHEFLNHQSLGTRELYYSTDAKLEDNIHKIERVTKNVEHKVEMEEEIHQIVYNFLECHHYIDRELPDEIKKYIYGQVQRLSILRATASTDSYNQELNDLVYPEVPTRLTAQMVILYKALKSLDPTYSDEKAKVIIRHIIDSSSFQIRRRIVDIYQESDRKEYSLAELTKKVDSGYKSVKRECEILWGMHVLKKNASREETGVIRKGNVMKPKFGWVKYYQWNDGKDNPFNMI